MAADGLDERRPPICSKSRPLFRRLNRIIFGELLDQAWTGAPPRGSSLAALPENGSDLAKVAVWMSVPFRPTPSYEEEPFNTPDIFAGLLLEHTRPLSIRWRIGEALDLHESLPLSLWRSPGSAMSELREEKNEGRHAEVVDLPVGSFLLNEFR